MENLVVDLTRVGEKVHFNAVSALNPNRPLPLDYVPPVGEGDGFAGLELLLISFCGCVSTAVVALLGRLGKHVSSYTVHAEGVRREQPLSLNRILFHVRLESPDATAADMETIFRQAEMISPVWIAIRNNVEVETSFEIA